MWERLHSWGRIPFVLFVVVFLAMPLAVFFATFTLFPFTMGDLFSRVDNPGRYLIFWAVLGLMYGAAQWHRLEKRQQA